MNPYDVNMFYFDLAGNRVRVEKDNDNEGTNPFVADETTTYEYDDNDRLLYELDANGGVIYEYGSNASPMSGYGGDHTTQTAKTIYENGSFVSKTTYLYEDGTGRMTGVEIDTTNDGNPETTISYIYNDDGIRVKKTETINIGEFNETETETIYHIDPNNHTGYAQIIEEGIDGNSDGNISGTGEVTKAFTLGHDVITQATASTASLIAQLMYDGHGSTRGLINASAELVEQYNFDAYGNIFGFTGTPSTELLYSGEMTDRLTGLQYLRARYYDPATGRFNRLDPYAGSTRDPQSLHKYLYAHANPVMGVDPSGQWTIGEIGTSIFIASLVSGITSGAISAVTGAFTTDDGIFFSFSKGFVSGFVGTFISLGLVVAHVPPGIAFGIGGAFGEATSQWVHGGFSEGNEARAIASILISGVTGGVFGKFFGKNSDTALNVLTANVKKVLDAVKQNARELAANGGLRKVLTDGAQDILVDVWTRGGKNTLEGISDALARGVSSGYFSLIAKEVFGGIKSGSSAALPVTAANTIVDLLFATIDAIFAIEKNDQDRKDAIKELTS